MRIRGFARLTVRNADGSIADRRNLSNFITAEGEEHIADQLAEGDEAAMGWIGIGSGSGQTRDDSTLDTEVTRVAFDTGYPQQGGTGEENYTYYFSTFDPNDPATDQVISEFAVFNDASAGTMLNYVSGFTPVTKLTAQTLEVESYIIIGSG